MTGPTAVVAGGASIGRVLCAAFAERGYRVVMLDAAARAGEAGAEVGAEARQCDLTDYGAIRGSVVNLSSTTALRGAPTMIAYSAATATPATSPARSSTSPPAPRSSSPASH